MSDARGKPSGMNFASALLYPIFLLLPAGTTDAAPLTGGSSGQGAGVPPDALPDGRVEWGGVSPVAAPGLPGWDGLILHAFPQKVRQVRVEQRVIIRITPRAATPMPDMFMGMPGEDGLPQVTERKIGKCLPMSGISSVRPDRVNRLLLFMRNRRVISAELERSCRARDFYSGFLLEPSEDGRICVDRDTLLSRSGMTCKITRIRELVEQDR